MPLSAEEAGLLGARRTQMSLPSSRSQHHLHPGEAERVNTSESHFQTYRLMGTCLEEVSMHGFSKGKSCLTNLIACYGEMTSVMGKARAVDVVYPDLSKALGTYVFHNIFVDKVTK